MNTCLVVTVHKGDIKEYFDLYTICHINCHVPAIHTFGYVCFQPHRNSLYQTTSHPQKTPCFCFETTLLLFHLISESIQFITFQTCFRCILLCVLLVTLTKMSFFLVTKIRFRIDTRKVEFCLPEFHAYNISINTCAVRETASLGIMGAPRVLPLNPSESIVLSEIYACRIVVKAQAYQGFFHLVYLYQVAFCF